jgi:hypothetical protein
MDDSEVLQAFPETGLPETATDTVLRGLRELIRDSASILDPSPVDNSPLRTFSRAEDRAPGSGRSAAGERPDARARRHPLGLAFLLGGMLASVAIMFGVHAFTVEAARKRLINEEVERLAEMTAP